MSSALVIVLDLRAARNSRNDRPSRARALIPALRLPGSPVLLVAGLALAAQALGFEAILGAFLAGLLVRALDPDPTISHPLYPVKLEAVGYGLLVPIFFVTSGLTLDLSGLVENPTALAAVPAFLLALLLVRGLPALAFRRELGRRDLLAVGLLQATSLPFLLAAVEIGHQMGLLDPAVGAGLVAAGLVSVLVFPAAALVLLPRTPRVAV